jgi:hypothetical protein
MGAGVEDLLSALGLPEDTGRHILFQRMGELHERLAPIGLAIKHNPIDHVFYLDTSIRSDFLGEETVLPDRLTATLLVLITLSYQEGDWVDIDRLRQFRRKTRRGVVEDLRELATQGYVEFDSTKSKVRPGNRVAFEIDYEDFFRKLSEGQPDT